MRKISIVIIFTYILATILSACSTMPPEVSSGGTPPPVSSSSTGETSSVTGETTKTTIQKSSSSATISTTAATTTERGVDVTYNSARIDFKNLSDYKKRLKSFTSVSILHKSLLDAAQYDQCAFEENDFSMLLKEKYFLVPVVSKGCSVESLLFSYGISEFWLTFSSGERMTLRVYHYSSDEPTRNGTVSSIVNNRDIKVKKEIKEEDYYYIWQEDNYYCVLRSIDCNMESMEAFAKALTFEKVAIK